MTTTTATGRTGIRTPINKTTMKRLASLAAAFLLPLSALAQEYPYKPVHVIVPYAAGGGADILARVVSQQLGERLKVPVIVDHLGGASNTIRMKAVATAAKDGYTLGLATPVFVMTPSLIKNHPYDTLRDF